MKLLHVIAGMDPKLGGVCQAVRTIVGGLADLGHSSEVVCTDTPDTVAYQTDAFPVHALGPAPNPWRYTSKLRPWLAQHLHRFEVVVLHGLWLHQDYALWKALCQLKEQNPGGSFPRLFIMPHGMLDPYFQQAAGRKLKAWRNRIYWWLIEEKVIKAAQGLLFTCETELLLARQSFRPYQPAQESVVGLGVPTPPPYSASQRQAFIDKCSALAQRPYLLFIGRIHEKKGVDLVLQAYGKLLRATVKPTQDNTSSTGLGTASSLLPALVIAGPGLDTPYGLHLQRLAAELPKPALVCFPGMLTGQAKWGALYGCEAFILPSYQENFGIAVVEALACGRPVLISDQVNIWREIANMEAGLVEAATLAGTQLLLERWLKLSTSQQLHMREQAQLCYHHYFAVAPAAARMLATLS